MTEYLRAAWNAAPSKKQMPALHNVPNGVVHDIGGGDPYPSNVASTLHMIQATEQHGDYVDIAYNWGVDQAGNLWELRGDVADGATKGFSGTSFSVLAICNASAVGFVATAPLVAGIAAAFRKAQDRGVLSLSPTIDGHTVFDRFETPNPTQCPGVLEASIPQIRTLVARPAGPPQEIPQDSPEGKTMIKVGHWDLLGHYHGKQVTGGAPVYGLSTLRRMFAQGKLATARGHDLYVRAVDKQHIGP